MAKKERLVPAKGARGYIDRIKKLAILVAIGSFLIAAAMFITGLFLFESKFNVLSIFAALVVIPFAGAITRFVLFSKYKSVSEEDEKKVFDASPAGSTTLSDVVMTSTERAMGFAFLVVTDNEVAALVAQGEKTPTVKLYEYLKDLVKRKGFGNSVEVLDDMDKFLKHLGTLSESPARAEDEEDPQVEVIEMLKIYMA
ncbi:MAG: hypothetical protein IKR54_04800 [Lachnospiraceae bacterium]|nr:hypothetical protein [Lachnospiraceae bacterium]